MNFVRVNSAASGNTSEVTTNTLTTGQTFIVHASGYDADGNYRSDESVTWSVTGGIGSVSPSSGVSTTLTAATPGTGVIQADHATAIDDATGIITVNAGNIDHILVRDAPDNGGSEVGAVGLTADETLTLYAAGYDAQDNYLGDVSVTWSSPTGNLAPAVSGTGSSFTFSPTTAPASGTIRGTHASAGSDDTGTITVSVGALNFVRVNSAASGNTSEVTTNTLTTGQTFIVHASGYDAAGNYRSDESVTWSVTGGIGSVSPSSGVSTTLTAATPGTGVIQADHATAIDDATGQITVIAGSITRIRVRNAPDNGGQEVGAVSLTADQSLTLYAAGYDASDIYLGDFSVTWSSPSGNLAPAVSGTGSSFTFSPTTAPTSGIIRATHSTAGTDDTGTLTVTLGVLNFIQVSSGASGNTPPVGNQSLSAGQTLTVHASGYDSDGNYRSDESVNWSVTGGIGTLDTAIGTSTIFSALTPGNGVILADHATVPDATTGTLTVIEGNVASVIIRDAPNNGGSEVGDTTLTADQSITLYAAGYDGQSNYVSDVTVTWRSGGSLDATGDPAATSFTFSPASAPTSGEIIADHATATDDSTGTITVTPGVPVGTVTLSPSPDTLAADGLSTSQITSSQIIDADGNPVGLSRLFTVSLSPPNLGTITDTDADLVAQGHQIATNAASALDFEFKTETISGTVTVFVSSDEGSASGDTTIVIGSMSIASISTASVFVSQGQSGITVNMVVKNTSGSDITNLGDPNAATLSFTGIADRSAQYSVTRTDGFTTIPAQQQATLTFSVTVDPGASTELITIDGQVSGFIGGTPVSAQGAAVTDSWTVQRPAQLRALTVSSSLDTVVVGQQGNSVTVTVSNPAPAGAATAVVTNVQLVFLENGVTDRSSDFTVIPEGNNPASLPSGGTPQNFTFTVGVGGSAPPGDYEIDVVLAGHDTNSTNLALQDNAANTRKNWFVKNAPNFQILSISTAPTNSFLAGQTTPWTVRMEVRNNGPDAIDLDFNIAKTFIRFIKGVTDVSGEYVIVQPSQLVVAGTDTLVSGATDTLDFTISQTGTSTGTIRIDGRIEGVDTGTNNPISDDTNDGGSGQVELLSQTASIFISQTNAGTINVSQGVGIVDTSQGFQINIKVKNDLQETVENVVVQLTSNGSSSISQNPLTLPQIPAGQTGSISFVVTAASTRNPVGETFTAQILSGTGQQSQQPANIGSPIDDDAIVRIQTPSLLSVTFTQIEPFQTAGETFTVQSKVTNAGEASVSSGQLQLQAPAGYTLLPGFPATQTFTVDNSVSWDVQAPAAPSGPDTFRVNISQVPIEFNTNALANVAVNADTEAVQTFDINLVIQNVSITSPAGATDNTLSTEQEFNLQAIITKSDNIDSVRADLAEPVGYSFAPGSNPRSQLLTGGATLVEWTLRAPFQGHSSPRTFQVRMRGYDEGLVRADTTRDLNVVSVVKAIMDFDDFNGNPQQTVRVSIGQQFQLTALVNNTGQAGVTGLAEVTLNLGTSGIISQEPLKQTFVPNTRVIWNCVAPVIATPAQSISVTLSNIPFDENTNNTASHNPQQLVRSFLIETGDLGNISVVSVGVTSPVGALDRIVSTEQEITVEAEIQWDNLVNPQAELILPQTAGYDVLGDGSRFRNIAQGPSTTVQWRLKAPISALSQHFVKVEARGKDASNPTVDVTALPDSVAVTVVAKARLNLSADITAPQPATDEILTVGQEFTITVTLDNLGSAALVGVDTVEITLPAGKGYSLSPPSQPSARGVLADSPVQWIVRAPNEPTTGEDIKIEVVNQNSTDENTNEKAPLTPIPPRVVIRVRTEAIGLNLAVLTDRKPLSIPRGITGQGLFGLQFNNNSDTEIKLESITFNLRDKESNDVAPSSVFSKLGVVDYLNPSTVVQQLSSVPAENPIVFHFSPVLSIQPNQTQALEFTVDIATQTEATHFQFFIDSPQNDIVAKDATSDTVVTIRDDTSGVSISGPIAPGISVLFDDDLNASFYNFPNPFGNQSRPSTRFNYRLAQDSDVTLRIFTLLGELVRTISFSSADPQGLAGTHAAASTTFVWDGTNENGQKVLNGVYVAVLVTNQGKAMTKIAVAR
ncbi:MAG: hypothetical protein ACE5IR_01980 [bacterium]